MGEAIITFFSHVDWPTIIVHIAVDFVILELIWAFIKKNKK